jgi:uncharacterized membrane protein
MIPLNDERIDHILARILRAGVILAAATVLAGGILYLAQNGRADARPTKLWHGEPAQLRSVPGILGAAAQLHSLGIIQLGLLLLVATPVARVVASVIVFALERDLLYVFITLFVLCVLLYSLIAG